MKLVVGLGNPGREYLGTRHNAGYEVVDLMAERAGVSWRRRSGRTEAAAGELLLLKPLTFMNLSGGPVAEVLGFRGLAPEDCLIVCDDMALPLGAVRLRAKGSSGGHHGLDSVIAALGTSAFPRLRVGIGAPPPGVDGADWVLGRFCRGEALPAARAADAAQAWMEKGIERAMGEFNTR